MGKGRVWTQSLWGTYLNALPIAQDVFEEKWQTCTWWWLFGACGETCLCLMQYDARMVRVWCDTRVARVFVLLRRQYSCCAYVVLVVRGACGACVMLMVFMTWTWVLINQREEAQLWGRHQCNDVCTSMIFFFVHIDICWQQSTRALIFHLTWFHNNTAVRPVHRLIATFSEAMIVIWFYTRLFIQISTQILI